MLWTLKKARYRAQQRVMKVAALVLPFPMPGILGGPGSVKQLAENLDVRALKHPLLVTDRTLIGLGLPAPLLESLHRRGIRAPVFADVQPNPTIEHVEAGVRAYRNNGCDCIIAFGGGSPMDCAKVIGARIANPLLSVRMMKGLMRAVLPIPPLFCVPTTAGTGSEATIAAIVLDASTREKFAITDLKLIPKIAVLDPELMVGLPPHITAATGMDALTHAIEAYIGLNGSRFSNENAEKATRLIFANLERAYDHGDDLEARYNMALASYFAGAAFTRAYVGYVHAIAHNIGGLYGVPHGLANAIILPHVLRYCRADAAAKMASLAVIGGIGERAESDDALSRKFIARIEQLNAKMGIPNRVAELRESDVPLIVERAFAEAHPDYPVPRIMTVQECTTLVRGLMA